MKHKESYLKTISLTPDELLQKQVDNMARVVHAKRIQVQT